MKQFACGDVVPGCAKVFTASTSDQILAEVAQHARRDHGLTEIPKSLVMQVNLQIRDIAA